MAKAAGDGIRARQAYQAYQAARTGRQSAARRLLALALGAILLVCGLGAGLLAPHYFAAQRVAAAFCAALRAGDAPAAWALLAPGARDGLTLADYARALHALDTAEGGVRSCVVSDLAGYAYTPGQAIASDTMTLTRERMALGATLELAQVGGAWRVMVVPQALYGAPLAAVATVADYCAALRAGDYAAAWARFSITLQGAQAQADYVAAQDARATLTGRVSSCVVIGLTTPESQTTQALVSVTRMNGPRLGGFVQLQPEDGVWRISDRDPNVEGVDVGPFEAGRRFCADLAAGDFTAAYGLLNSSLQARTSPAALADLSSTRSGALRCGAPISGSYQVAGEVASYTAPLLTASGAPAGRTLSLQFALIQGTWWISAL